MKFILPVLLFMIAPMWAGDIPFISPVPNSQIKDQLVIQIPPAYQNKNVRVWIQNDPAFGRDKVMWKGKLTPQNNYTVTVDVSKFPAGKYEVKAKFYVGVEEVDGDVDVWIGDVSANQYYYED